MKIKVIETTVPSILEEQIENFGKKNYIDNIDFKYDLVVANNRLEKHYCAFIQYAEKGDGFIHYPRNTYDIEEEKEITRIVGKASQVGEDEISNEEISGQVS
jgi:hypothetical protein